MKKTVAIVRCPDYHPQRVAEAVQEMLEALGGVKAFAGPGSSVLIKPNMLTDAAPEQAKTTHPEPVRALIRLLRRAGATVSVGDSPVKAARLDAVWEKTGFRALCAAENVTPVRFERHATQALRCGNLNLQIAGSAMEADLVANFAKVKTHIFTTFTGAIKNLYGTLPGYQKTLLHRKFPAPADFGRLPAALYESIRPGLNLADAIVAMNGDGPSGGDPVKLGFLAASSDAVALDTALCVVLGIEPQRLPWSRHLPPDASALLKPENIEYPLSQPHNVKPLSFRVPAPLWPRLIPGSWIRHLGRLAWIRPRFGPECIRCGLCVKACCNNALRLHHDSPRPLLRAGYCVACCCCHEVCPARAVTMRQSPLLRWALRGESP